MKTIPCAESREGVTVCTYQTPAETSTLDLIQEILYTASLVMILALLGALTYVFVRTNRPKKQGHE